MDPIEITPTSLLIIGAISLILGILATLLLNSLREESALDEGAVDTPPGGKKGRYHPVARLWREKGTGQLVVEMDGRSLVTPEPLNETQLERLEKAERDLRAWLGMGLAASAPAPLAEPVVPVPATVVAHQAAAPESAHPPAVPYTPPPAAVAIPAPVIGALAQEPPARSNRSIVEQIEDILQDMLVGSPLAARGIHLHQDPARGVMVQVGRDYYEGIDAVPDSEIKSLLKSAVAAWEKSQ